MAQEPLAYNTNLRAPITTEVNSKPKARVHSREWQKIMNAEPVEINPSVGYGYKVRMRNLHRNAQWLAADGWRGRRG